MRFWIYVLPLRPSRIFQKFSIFSKFFGVKLSQFPTDSVLLKQKADKINYNFFPPLHISFRRNSHFNCLENWFMQFVVKLDIVPDEFVTNIITEMKMFQPMTEFRLAPRLFQSSKYTLSVNYFCEKLFTLKGNIIND